MTAADATFSEHAVHEDFFRAHMVTKGQELAAACLSIIENLAAVVSPTGS